MSTTHGKPGGPKRGFANAYPPRAVCVCERPKLSTDEDGDARCIGCGKLIEAGVRRADG